MNSMKSNSSRWALLAAQNTTQHRPMIPLNTWWNVKPFSLKTSRTINSKPTGGTVTSFFSFKYHFSFSFRFGGIFILNLTFLYVGVVRLMTTLSKSEKSKTQSLRCIFCCSTISKTGYTSVHSTLSSMQNVMVQFQKYPPTQGHPSSVSFSCCQITT